MIIAALREFADSADVEFHLVSEARHDRSHRIDAVADIITETGSVRLVIESKNRAPYPSEARLLEDRREQLAWIGLPTLVCPYVNQRVGKVLSDLGWSWLDNLGNADVRAPGMRISLRTPHKPPRTKASSLPQGSGSLAIIRSLINSGRVDNVTGLGDDAGVSQPRASQVLRRLVDLELVHRDGRSAWTADRERLLDAFLDEYRGPGGSTRYLYCLDAARTTAHRLAEAANSMDVTSFAISGDVAADELAPWRTPSVLVVYASAMFQPDAVQTVEAGGQDDANVIWVAPEDRSVFGSRQVLDSPLPLADPAQILWDLRRLGGSDRAEAAEELRRWILSR